MLGIDPVVSMIRRERGLAQKLAKRLGITGSTVRGWKQVPSRHAHAVARYFNMHPHVVRPDIFPPPRRPKRIDLDGKR